MTEHNELDVIITGEDDGRDAPPQVAECGYSGVINLKNLTCITAD